MNRFRSYWAGAARPPFQGIPTDVPRFLHEDMWRARCAAESRVMQGYKDRPFEPPERNEMGGFEIVRHGSYIEVKPRERRPVGALFPSASAPTLGQSRGGTLNATNLATLHGAADGRNSALRTQLQGRPADGQQVVTTTGTANSFGRPLAAPRGVSFAATGSTVLAGSQQRATMMGSSLRSAASIGGGAACGSSLGELTAHLEEVSTPPPQPRRQRQASYVVSSPLRMVQTPYHLPDVPETPPRPIRPRVAARERAVAEEAEKLATEVTQRRPPQLGFLLHIGRPQRY
eukprot:TRINITY_DN31636_c0_g1_i1.p1 TRINITY_DN31636_c0_g1~~TRINITY_DN31636_c0_g1_i1.p1  ORF type:complete len:316 (-),score=55.15 TRINITY_DN31636_c0_g1_i1:185-1048(-)